MTEERESLLNLVMMHIPPSHRYRWCGGEMGPCACMGCVNNELVNHEFTKEDHQMWMEKHPKDDLNDVHRTYWIKES